MNLGDVRDPETLAGVAEALELLTEKARGIIARRAHITSVGRAILGFALKRPRRHLVVIAEGLGREQTVTTALHEFGHVLFGHGAMPGYRAREAEAEVELFVARVLARRPAAPTSPPAQDRMRGVFVITTSRESQ